MIDKFALVIISLQIVFIIVMTVRYYYSRKLFKESNKHTIKNIKRGK